MKCSDSKKLIYLYTEINDGMRVKLMEHLKTCRDCSIVFEAFQRDQKLINASFVPPATDHAILTNRIIRKIREAGPKRNPVMEQLFWLIDSKPLKYGLASISLILITQFSSEWSLSPKDRPVAERQAIVPRQAAVKLNTAYFKLLGDKLRKREYLSTPENISFYECLQNCTTFSRTVCAECIGRSEKN